MAQSVEGCLGKEISSPKFDWEKVGKYHSKSQYAGVA